MALSWILCEKQFSLSRVASSRLRAKKAISYVQPSVFDMLAGANPASAMDGWA